MKTVGSIILALVMVLLVATTGQPAKAADVRAPSNATQATLGAVPGNVSGNLSDATIWGKVRHGAAGSVTIPDKKAAVLVQDGGERLRLFRNGAQTKWGTWILLAAVMACVAMYVGRGKIRIESGPSGRTVQRFNELERFTHWLTAGSFIVLGLSGLNMMFGKFVLLPVIGASAFGTLTLWGKYAHDFLGFAFMVGLILLLIIWLRHNIPNRLDIEWLKKGGGLFSEGTHVPARKFNAGQKLIYWAVILLGISLSASGLALFFPYDIHLFGGTFKLLNLFGLELETNLTPLMETQLALVWHGTVALVMVAITIAHIYIGSIGMEGALDAVVSGDVDENWAREHHELWLEEINTSVVKSEPAE